MSRRAVADRMAGAAADLLDALDDEQRAVAAWPFPADDERRRWFYTPTDHGGLPLRRRCDPASSSAAMRLLRSGLSRGGVRHGVDDHRAGERARRGRAVRASVRTASVAATRGCTTCASSASPAAGETWGWRFGGHHVSVNHTIVDGELVSSTPCFLGADPASSTAARAAPAAPARRRRGPRARAGPLARRRAARPGAAARRPSTWHADRPRSRRRPAAAARHSGGCIGRRMRRQARWRRRRLHRHVDAAPAPRCLRAAARRRTCGACPRRLRPASRRAGRRRAASTPTDDALDELSFAWAGGLEPGEPHYYRVQGGDAARRVRQHAARRQPRAHASGATSAPTSAATCSPPTTPTTTDGAPLRRSPSAAAGCSSATTSPAPATTVEQVAGDLVGLHSTRSGDRRAVAAGPPRPVRRRRPRGRPVRAAHAAADAGDAPDDVRRPARPGRGDGRRRARRRSCRASGASSSRMLEEAGVTDDVEAWIERVGDETLAALRAHGAAAGEPADEARARPRPAAARSPSARSTRARSACRRGCCSCCRPRGASPAPGRSARGCRASTAGCRWPTGSARCPTLDERRGAGRARPAVAAGVRPGHGRRPRVVDEVDEGRRRAPRSPTSAPSRSPTDTGDDPAAPAWVAARRPRRHAADARRAGRRRAGRAAAGARPDDHGVEGPRAGTSVRTGRRCSTATATPGRRCGSAAGPSGRGASARAARSSPGCSRTSTPRDRERVDAAARAADGVDGRRARHAAVPDAARPGAGGSWRAASPRQRRRRRRRRRRARPRRPRRRRR